MCSHYDGGDEALLETTFVVEGSRVDCSRPFLVDFDEPILRVMPTA